MPRACLGSEKHQFDKSLVCLDQELISRMPGLRSTESATVSGLPGQVKPMTYKIETVSLSSLVLSITSIGKGSVISI